MADTSNTSLAEPWRQLWNGDLTRLDALVAEDILIHAVLVGGTGDGTLRGRTALGGWIAGLHAVMDGLAFAIEVGPIADADHLVIRWRAHGTYRGGFPGTPMDAVGCEVDFTGTDILRVAYGVLAEYWVNSDMLLLMQQLGMRLGA